MTFSTLREGKVRGKVMAISSSGGKVFAQLADPDHRILGFLTSHLGEIEVPADMNLRPGDIVEVDVKFNKVDGGR